MERLADDEREVPDVSDVPVSRVRVFLAGLAVAAAVMLIAEMFMMLILRQLVFLLVAAPVTGAFVLTAGAAVGWFAGRISSGMDQRKASLTFFAAGFLAGGLWGFPIVTLLNNASAEATGSTPAPLGAVLAGSLYLASTAGLGGLAGRYFGPFVAARGRLLAMIVAVVLLVTVGSLLLLTLFPL